MRVRTLTLYGRPECDLCEEMKAAVRQVAARVPLELHEVDVSGDRELERRYGLDVPVLLVDGREAFRHRATVAELVRWLELRTEEA
ncbi:MAG: glutaredoxin family protein [Candidatus Binatia bacterium]